MNTETTLFKTLKTLVWVGGSAALVAILSTITNHSEIYNPTIVVIANVLLVALKNLLDPSVKNI